MIADDTHLICPYCGREQLNSGDDEVSSVMVLATCEFCNRQFWYSVEVERHYESSPYETEDRPAGED